MRHALVAVVVLCLSTLTGSSRVVPLDDVFDVVTPDYKDVNATCVQIQMAISNHSEVFFPSDSTGHYRRDNVHYVVSSSQPSVCSVEPGTAEDVGILLQILGNSKTPFAVKGGGHSTNPGFSSTPGVQITMSRFNEVKYIATEQTAEVGAGLVWDDVYAALDPHGVNVIGGRISGIGVAGFTLGGGYSFLTNQYGLGVDNVVAFELVLPSGTVKTVTQSATDLFFALKGGFNNFGIVTRFTLKTHPQGRVWGGYLTFPGNITEQVNAATSKFMAEVTDPKASMLHTFGYIPAPGISILTTILFYDAPEPPAGVFDDFLMFPALQQNIAPNRTFLSLVQAPPSNATSGPRGIYQAVSVRKFDDVLLQAMVNETNVWGKKMGSLSGTAFGYSIEPFLPSIFTHGSDSAYPPVRSPAFFPISITYAWALASADDAMFDAIKQSSAQLTAVAKNDGQDIDNAPLYPNYAIFDTPLQAIYGDNVARLKEIKLIYDPLNIMGLAGGWKF